MSNERRNKREFYLRGHSLFRTSPNICVFVQILLSVLSSRVAGSSGFCYEMSCTLMINPISSFRRALLIGFLRYARLNTTTLAHHHRRPPTTSSHAHIMATHAGIKSTLISRIKETKLLTGCTAVILLSFVLAVGFLMIILSCALWSNWLPLLVGACM